MFDLVNEIIIQKFIKFGIVGFSGLFVDFGITYLGKEKLNLDKFVSNSIGFCTASASNYIFNRIWTFQSTNPQIFVEFGEFFIIALFGLSINTLILWILNQKYKINFYFSKLIAIGVVTIWNFGANILITFN
jgi:putative flippase GtrA